MTDPSSRPDDAGHPPAEQRWLENAMRVGVALGLVGLVTTTLIIVVYLSGGQTPGTWAYLLALTAPLGFAIVLATVVGVAVRRRRDALRGTGRTGSQAD